MNLKWSHSGFNLSVSNVKLKWSASLEGFFSPYFLNSGKFLLRMAFWIKVEKAAEWNVGETTRDVLL